MEEIASADTRASSSNTPHSQIHVTKKQKQAEQHCCSISQWLNEASEVQLGFATFVESETNNKQNQARTTEEEVTFKR